MTFNPWNTLVFLICVAIAWALIMRLIRYEVRTAILDYANRLKARQFAPTKDPYDAFCADLHKELGRE